MTDQTLIDRARAAVPGWTDLDRARREAATARATFRDQRASTTDTLVATAVDRLVAGQGLPPKLPEQAHEARTAAAQRRADTLQVLRAVEQDIHARRDAALAEGISHALDTLHIELDALIGRARDALGTLGEIGDAGEAIAAGDDTAGAWRVAATAAEQYVALRRAQARLVHEATTGTRAERDGGHPTPTWGPRRLRPEAAVMLLGHWVEHDEPYEGPDAGPALLAALLGDGMPMLGVPGPDEIRTRAENLDRPAEPDPDPVVITPQHPYQVREGAPREMI